jgi:small conductance mechanosensitive channel
MENFNMDGVDIQEIIMQGQIFVAEYALKVLAAIAIYFIGRLIAKTIAKTLLKTLEKRGIDTTISKFAHNMTYATLLIFVILAALSQVGIQTASFIAILGAAGLAVGLALQGSLSNFAAGILMIIFRPFKIGDYVEAGGKAGTVEDIQIFATQLKSPDNKVIIIPNSAIMNDSIVNYSRKEMRRVDLKIGVSYDAYLPDVKALLIKTVQAHDLVLADQPVQVAVSELGDSSVNFIVRVWSKTPDYWTVFFDLTETIKLTLDENNISIPFPQVDVHMQK